MSNLDSLWILSTDNQFSELSRAVDSVQYQLTMLQTKTDLVTGIIETSNDSIANQLSSASTLLEIIAIVIAVVGGIVGLYINRKKQQVEELAKTVDEKKKLVDSIAETTKKLDEQINNNVSDLYKKLRKEETNTLLDRLVLEPYDICNILSLLLARDLDDDGFAKIKESYLKLDESSLDCIPGEQYDYKGNYLLLLFQHYCCQSMQDDRIRPAMMERFDEEMKQAFKRDIIKSTIDFCKAISDNDSSFNKEEALLAYLKAVNGSKFAALADLKNILEQNITPKELLQKAIDKCKNEGVYLAMFGMTAPSNEKGT